MVNVLTILLIVLVAAPLGAAGPAGVTDDAAASTRADELFRGADIPHLRLEISEPEMARLRAYRWQRDEPPESRPTVSATVREGATVYTNVAVHLKGGFGSFRPVDTKPGLTLHFSKFAKGQRFHGLQKISLNNSVQDPSWIADKLGRELFARAGVPVPRADYATAELNGRPLGLYVLTEGWDKPFLKRYFKNADGNLYDPPVAWDINKTLRLGSGEKTNDQSELKAVVKAAALDDPEARLARLEALVDLDRFLSFIALDVMIWNWDGYAMNKNNYRVFHDLETHRLVFMPHGLDQLFWRPQGPIVTGRNGLVARALMGTTEGRRRYLERFSQLYTNLFEIEALTRRVQQLAARIRPAIARQESARLAQFDGSVILLNRRIAERARSIDEQLAGVKRLLVLAPNEPVRLRGWKPRVVSGRSLLEMSAPPDALHLSAQGPGAGAWFTPVWLEEGNYRIEGRLKTQGITADPQDPLGGAGLRVWSERKASAGVHWNWFPYQESRDLLRRGELAATNFVPRRIVGTTDWTDVTYRIELRQPIADLEVRCELYGRAGEAWFDLKSLKIVRE